MIDTYFHFKKYNLPTATQFACGCFSRRLIKWSAMMEIHNNFISNECKDHGKLYELYCSNHDQVLCVDCIYSKHIACTKLIPVKEAARGCKSSSALSDLEDKISRILINIPILLEDCTKASDNIDHQNKLILEEIQTFRHTLNRHLDSLEQSLVREIDGKHTIIKSNHTHKLQYLQSVENDVKRKEAVINILRTQGSELEIFLGTRQLNKEIHHQFQALTKETELISDSATCTTFILNPIIDKILTEVKSFGDIDITEKPRDIQLDEVKAKHAQMRLRPLKEANAVPLQKFLDMNVSNSSNCLITGCTISPGGRLFICNYNGQCGSLSEYNTNDGLFVCIIPTADPPYDVTTIDTDTIAVTFGSKSYLQMININTKQAARVELNGSCFGISFQGERLYIVVTGVGIVVVNILGEVLHTIKVNVNNVYHLSTTRDRIYYTDLNKNTMNCLTMNGREIWTFTEPAIVSPRGLSTVNNKNVLVVGLTSKTLSLIRHDGKDSKTLLTTSDGLCYLRAMNYDEDQKVLCLGNGSGCVSLYKVHDNFSF